MITEKIPKPDRDRIPVLAEGNHVVWLVGYRISEYYKINVHTKRVLQVQLICKDEDPETK
jgi:tRNA(Ile)-lysidine synthase